MSARSAHNPTRKAVTHNSADCLSPTETGPCRGRFKVFGFDAAQQSCVEFVYGGTVSHCRENLVISNKQKEGLNYCRMQR